MNPSDSQELRQLRHAAMWVVLMWDTEQSQHGSMPALRQALGLPGERPIREEARERMNAYLQTPCALGAEDCCSTHSEQLTGLSEREIKALLWATAPYSTVSEMHESSVVADASSLIRSARAKMKGDR